MDRRKFLLNTSGMVAGGLLLPRLGLGAGAEGLPAGTVESSVLDALPGKRPLIKRTFRPPNYETPVELFREAYTPSDSFYVRWHSGVPDVRLPTGGCASRTCRAEAARVFARGALAQVQACRGRCGQPVLRQPARPVFAARARGAVGLRRHGQRGVGRRPPQGSARGRRHHGERTRSPWRMVPTRRCSPDPIS